MPLPNCHPIEWATSRIGPPTCAFIELLIRYRQPRQPCGHPAGRTGWIAQATVQRGRSGERDDSKNPVRSVGRNRPWPAQPQRESGGGRWVCDGPTCGSVPASSGPVRGGGKCGGRAPWGHAAAVTIRPATHGGDPRCAASIGSGGIRSSIDRQRHRTSRAVHPIRPTSGTSNAGRMSGPRARKIAQRNHIAPSGCRRMAAPSHLPNTQSRARTHLHSPDPAASRPLTCPGRPAFAASARGRASHASGH